MDLLSRRCQPLTVLACATGAALAAVLAARRMRSRAVQLGAEPAAPPTAQEVLVVGAGPAGATAAYFIAKAGLRVTLLDRKAFPRVKICADAWCAPALDLLEEMEAPGGGSVLAAMERDGICNDVRRGGFISPSGEECINTSGAAFGTVSGCRTYAIKRHQADEYLVRAAVHAGARLLEEWEVRGAELEPQEGGGKLWRVSCGDDPSKTLQGRLLIICDGSTSYLAQKLRLIPEGPGTQAVCSHRYIKSSGWQGSGAADGVLIYTRAALPGYTALFRHADGTIYYGSYALPGGKATDRSLAPLEKDLAERHPYVRAAVGASPADAKTTASRYQLAPIRLGGIARDYGDHVLVAGDAAGHVDPLTGEGIHLAMVAGKIAAGVTAEMFTAGDFSERSTVAYHWRCWDAFASDFWISALAGRLLFHFPVFMDATVRVGRRKGQWFLDWFGEIMTGVRPKVAFLSKPLLMLEIVFEVVPALLATPKIPRDVGQAAVDKFA